jgi:hypothetical protein
VRSVACCFPVIILGKARKQGSTRLTNAF